MSDDFNGIVSLLIASLELLLLINIAIFVEKNSVNIKIIILIFLLFLYQLFEFLICYASLNSSLTIYFAFASITFLPPLGLHIVSDYLFKETKKYYLFYIPAVILLLYYVSIINLFEAEKCTVLYAVYNYPLGFLYGVLYYSPVIITFLLLLNSFIKVNDPDKKKQLRILLIGYGVTFLPMSAALFFYPAATSFIESVLCKFAIVLAISYSLFALRNGKSKNISFNYLKKL